MYRPLWLLCLFAVTTAGTASAIELRPHRAVYSLRLTGAEVGSGVVDASGAMVFEWAESCDSWIVRQRARFDMFGPEGNAVRTEVSFSSWEHKTGDRYGFNLRTLQDGNVVEDLRGEARLDGEGEGGTVTYTRPEPGQTALPPGTLFPAGHTRLLIREAMAGKNRALRPVLLGQREDEPMTVNAEIAERRADARMRTPTAGREALADNPLLAPPSWNMALAFYGRDDDMLPAFEIRETLYASGVVGDAQVIYDEFSLAYRLEQLEALPEPRC
ncbi:MAG: EipB family protein [Alphaproteobacteria bacterium]